MYEDIVKLYHKTEAELKKTEIEMSSNYGAIAEHLNGYIDGLEYTLENLKKILTDWRDDGK